MTCRELAELAKEYELQNPKKPTQRPIPAGLRVQKEAKQPKIPKPKWSQPKG